MSSAGKSSANTTTKKGKQKDKPKKPSLDEAFAKCWDKRRVKKMQIFEKNDRDVQITSPDEEFYKCILEHVQELQAAFNAKGKDETSSGQKDQVALEQQISKLEEEQKSLKNELEKIKNQCKQLWQQLGDDSSKMQNKFPDAVEVVKQAEKRICELRTQLSDQAGKTQHDMVKKEREIKELKDRLSKPPDRESQERQGDVATVADLEQQNNELRQKVSDIEEEVDQYKNISELNKSGIQTATHPKEDVGITEDTKHWMDEYESLQREFNKAKDAIEELAEQLNEKDAEISEKLSAKDIALTETEAKCKELEKQVEDNKSQLQKLQDKSAGQKQDDEANDAIKKLVEENEKLKHQLIKQKGEAETENKRLNTELRQQKDRKEANEAKEAKQLLEQKDKEIRDLLAAKVEALKEADSKYKKVQKQLAECSTQIIKLKEHTEAIKVGEETKFLREQVKSLTERLATEMNSKVSADESSLENISIGNRPMKLADDYQHFCSNVWLDAKQALDEDGTLDQKEAIVLLKKILLKSEEKCAAAAKHFNAIFLQVLTEPVKTEFSAKGGKELTAAIPDSARALFNTVGDYLRRTADNTNLQTICQVVTKEVSTKPGILKIKEIETYLADSVRLSWKMVIQRPTMLFSVEGEGKKWQGDKSQELYWGSNPDNKGAVVRYYVHPILRHGDKLMVKGRVVVE